MLPDRTNLSPPADLDMSVGEWADAYSLHGKLFRLRVRAQSKLSGMTLAESGLGHDYEITVLSVKHHNDGEREPIVDGWGLDDVLMPDGNTVLRPGDELLVRATAPIVQKAMGDFNFGVQVSGRVHGAPLRHVAFARDRPGGGIGDAAFQLHRPDVSRERLLQALRRAGDGRAAQQRAGHAPTRQAAVRRFAPRARHVEQH